MVKLHVEQTTLSVSEADYKLTTALLRRIGLTVTVEKIPLRKKYMIMEELYFMIPPRASNILKDIVPPYMEVSTFVELYPKSTVFRCGNIGKKTISKVEEVLNLYGYIWK